MDVPTALPATPQTSVQGTPPTSVTGTPPAIELAALQAAVAADLPAFLDDLRELVDIDCGSYTPEGVNRVADWAVEFLGALGASVERRPDSDARLGDTVVA